jgi:regulator of protease activity HflC (stomatin/prohibitin superfamily)
METKIYTATVVFVLSAFVAALFGYPHYKVWSAGMAGRASLMQAEQERKIQIEQAKAELESAKLRAEAISIVGKASKEFPEYRTQEFIGAFAEAIKSDKVEQIIYVPTEANIPIVEARR